MPQSVQEQNIQALKLMERRFRDLAVVGEIGRRSKAVAIDLGFSVNQNDRFKLAPRTSTGPSIGRNSSRGNPPNL